MKIAMIPSPADVSQGESGINTVIRKYAQHLPKLGVQFVDADAGTADLIVVHAGMRQINPSIGLPVYAHLHGMYWTADFPYQRWQHASNAAIVQNLRHATGVSVPSRWVALPFQRDMRFTPDIIPHGVDWKEWDHQHENHGYVLWAKNRTADVCDPSPLGWLARNHNHTTFVTTFAPQNPSANMRITGVMEHSVFRDTMQKAAVYLSTTEETFGVATLEALAAGVPVLGFAHGGNLDLVEHGVTGYLAIPDDPEDLVRGLEYCLTHRKVLSANAKMAARKWTWESAAQIVYDAYLRAIYIHSAPPSVAVVIPVYNKTAEQVERAIVSVARQTRAADEIIVVDDGSTAGVDYAAIAKDFDATYIHKENGGVATARNRGGYAAESKYLCFLDSDDAIAPGFLEACVSALEKDNSIHLAYTRITTRQKTADGDYRESLSAWPSGWDFDQQLERHNQVPTCNVMRAGTFRRLGGFRQRYAPTGAGSEDADLWLRFGAAGYRAKLVHEEGLFIYTLGGGHTSQNYVEPDWLTLHPYASDKIHPLASHAHPVNGTAHPVTRYRPIVSVIIPVGPNHGETIVDALDSLEAQTERHWEAIVVEDTTAKKPFVPQGIKDAYPHVTWLFSGKKGVGAARNIGVDHATADFILFLDADDHLSKDALTVFLYTWGETKQIVYSDYLSITTVDNPDKLLEDVQKDPSRELVAVNEKTGEVLLRHQAGREFDCERAQRQPEDGADPYLWCLVTTLLPKAWHYEIGGFDETMLSYEDVDYHWRLARAGRCYTRAARTLVVYNFGTGTQRELGWKNAKKLMAYLREKYQGVDTMACGCGNKNPAVERANDLALSQTLSVSGGETVEYETIDGKRMQIADGDLILVSYSVEQKGAHKVIGASTRIVYGRREGGDRFLAHRNDVISSDGRGREIFSSVFIPVKDIVAPRAPVQVPPPPTLRVRLTADEGTRLVEELTEQVTVTSPASRKPDSRYVERDLTLVKGIGEKIAAQLAELGIATVGDLVVAGEAALKTGGIEKAREVVANALLYLSERDD